MIFVAFFSVIGFINLVVVWQGQGSLFLTVLMGVIAFLETIYAGFVLSYVAAIPLWNTALLPALYTVASLWGGIGLLVVINLMSGHEIELMESWARILLLAYGFMMVLYLLTMRYRSRAAAASIERMVKGDMATLFWGGVVMVGFVYPCIVNMMGLAGGVAPGVLVTAVLCEGLGDLSMRYCILKSALYAPLIPAREI